MPGRLLLVTPPVVVRRGTRLEIDPHFENNLAGYLSRVDRVAVACTPAEPTSGSGISNSIPVEEISIADRFELIVLPEAYREDRYLRNLPAVRRLLTNEIERSDYLSFSPHAPFDWPTLAAKIAIGLGREYDLEADWDMANVSWMLWSTMRPGPNKFRKYLWFKKFLRDFDHAMRHSSVALLQGADVYDAYKDVAPNAYQVLNVQVTREDFITPDELEKKIAGIQAGDPLRISYAGRASDMKGPFHWLKAVGKLRDMGIELKATWFGDGDLLEEMRAFVVGQGLADVISLPGNVDRALAMAEVRRSHVFMFCHLAAESPRCVVEALASGTPIVGYGSGYTRDLVAEQGGGDFVETGNWQGLATRLSALHNDRIRLAGLVRQAHATSQRFDRDEAIRQRIDLIVRHQSNSIPTEEGGPR
jgi:glycosyltransferase involved in cell wall biosynthesis